VLIEQPTRPHPGPAAEAGPGGRLRARDDLSRAGVPSELVLGRLQEHVRRLERELDELREWGARAARYERLAEDFAEERAEMAEHAERLRAEIEELSTAGPIRALRLRRRRQP